MNKQAIQKSFIQSRIDGVSDRDESFFLPTVLTQLYLPRSKPDQRILLINNNDRWMEIKAGNIDEGFGPVAQPLPYGSTPRVIMSYLTTYALLHRTAEIDIGRNPQEFFSKMGMIIDRRRHKQLREQMHALASCAYKIFNDCTLHNVIPIQYIEAWPERSFGFTQKKLILSHEFYESVLNSLVPLDLKSIDVLSGSSIAIDIYIWLANRLHTVQSQQEIVTWSQLRNLFNPMNQTPNFRRVFETALSEVKDVYPQAKVKLISEGLKLHESQPPSI